MYYLPFLLTLLAEASLLPALRLEYLWTWDQSVQQETCVSQAPLICVLSPFPGSSIHGVANFRYVWENDKCEVDIQIEMSFLTPKVFYALHIHENGDLSSPDGALLGQVMSNPVGIESTAEEENLWGDLGTVEADHVGSASYKRNGDVLNMLGPCVGRALVVHSKENRTEDEKHSPNDKVAACVVGFASIASKI